VTVNQLDCGIGVMSRHLHDVLGAARHASIDFRLASYEVDLRTAPPVARIAGVVTIAGVQRPVTTTATVREDSLGFLHVQGTYLIRPTEFGIAPPRRFGGLLRVRDRAAVHFDIALEPVGGWASDDRRWLFAASRPRELHGDHSRLRSSLASCWRLALCHVPRVQIGSSGI
jgi:hypothetical protein